MGVSVTLMGRDEQARGDIGEIYGSYTGDMGEI